MFSLSDFTTLWTSISVGISLSANLLALFASIFQSCKGTHSSRLVQSYILCILLQLAHLSLVRLPLVYTLWAGVYPFGSTACQGTCVFDFGLQCSVLVFMASSLLLLAFLGRLTRNAIALSLSMGILAGLCTGLQACLNDSGTCFGYFSHDDSKRKSSDWALSLGTNAFSILSLIVSGVAHFFIGKGDDYIQADFLFGILTLCSLILVNLPRTMFFFYPPSNSTSGEVAKEFVLYVLTRLLPDTSLLVIPLGFLFLISNQRQPITGSREELRCLIDTTCPTVLCERLAQSQTTIV